MSSTFFSSTKLMIKLHQWEQLALYQNPEQSSKEVNQTNQWLLGCILECETFSQEAYHAVQRLFGPLSPREWTNHILNQWTPFPALECFLDNHSLDLHSTPSIMEYVLTHALYDDEYILRILTKLIQHGADVNEKEPRRGFPLLLSYLHWMNEYNDDHSRYEDRTFIPFLLQNGADPLLPSKEGITPLDYVKSLQERHDQHDDDHDDDHDDVPSPEYISWLLAELERYA